MRYPHPETTKRLRERKNGSFAKLRAELGVSVSKATLSRIARGVGPVSLATENEVRAALGLPAIIPATAPAPVCPHCGVVHAVDDCGGVPGLPVILPLDARIVRRKRKRPAPPAWVSQATNNLQSLLDARRPPEPFKHSRAWWRRHVKR